MQKIANETVQQKSVICIYQKSQALNRNANVRKERWGDIQQTCN